MPLIRKLAAPQTKTWENGGYHMPAPHTGDKANSRPYQSCRTMESSTNKYSSYNIWEKFFCWLTDDQLQILRCEHFKNYKTIKYICSDLGLLPSLARDARTINLLIITLQLERYCLLFVLYVESTLPSPTVLFYKYALWFTPYFICLGLRWRGLPSAMFKGAVVAMKVGVPRLRTNH